MITHIVLFKLIDRSKENIEKTRDIILSMNGKIPELRHLEVGIDLLHSTRSYDLALIAKFDTLKDLQSYQINMEHAKVLQYLLTVRESSVAIDYEDTSHGKPV